MKGKIPNNQQDIGENSIYRELGIKWRKYCQNFKILGK